MIFEMSKFKFKYIILNIECDTEAIDTAGSLSYAPQQIKSDRDLVLAAVSSRQPTHGRALAYACTAFKTDQGGPCRCMMLAAKVH